MDNCHIQTEINLLKAMENMIYFGCAILQCIHPCYKPQPQHRIQEFITLVKNIESRMKVKNYLWQICIRNIKDHMNVHFFVVVHILKFVFVCLVRSLIHLDILFYTFQRSF